MRRAFLEFLVSQHVISRAQLDPVQNVLRAAPEPIGAIAFSHGMITGADIDEVLDEQRNQHRPFGEIAINRGLLSIEQVETLLGVQRIRAATDIAEALALAGFAPIETVMATLGQFLAQHESMATA